MKKILSILILSILIASMVGCSSNELVKVDDNNTTTQVQEAVGNDDKKHILDSKFVDGTLVVKAQINYNGDWDFVFKYNLLVIGEIAQGLNLSNIDELQYWSVCQTTDGGTKKIFSCTMGKNQLQMIQDGKVYSTDISNMTSKMTDLYLDSELLQGLSSKVASQIIINDTKEKDHTENIKDTTQTEESEQVVQSKNKTAKKQTEKTNSNTEKNNSNTEKNNTTKKVQQTKNKTVNEEKQQPKKSTKKQHTTKEEDNYYDENGQYVGPKHSSMDDRKNSICDNCKHPIDDCICDFEKENAGEYVDYNDYETPEEFQEQPKQEKKQQEQEETPAQQDNNQSQQYNSKDDEEILK